MATIMELFASELTRFTDDMEKLDYEVEFDDSKYPARLVMRQSMPPLYEAAENGVSETQYHRAQIKVLGWPDIEVVTSGNLQMSKKGLNNIINSADKLLVLYLHGYMQDQKEREQ